MDILHKMMFVKHFWQLFVFLLPTFMKTPRRNCVSLIGRTSSCLAWRSSQGANKPYPFEEQMRPSCHSIFSFVCPNPFLGSWQAPFFAPKSCFCPPGVAPRGSGLQSARNMRSRALLCSAPSVSRCSAFCAAFCGELALCPWVRIP